MPYPAANQGLPPFPLNPHDKVCDNHFLLPSLIEPVHFKTLFGFSPEDFYQIRDSYVITSTVSMILTPDAIASLYLFKMRENLDFDSLRMIWGVGRESARYWFYSLSLGSNGFSISSRAQELVRQQLPEGVV